LLLAAFLLPLPYVLFGKPFQKNKFIKGYNFFITRKVKEFY